MSYLPNHIFTERDIADLIVAVVCHCGTRDGGSRHARGYPECSTARAAARLIVQKYGG